MKLILPLLLLIMVGCNPLKKAVRTFDENKPAAALYCADRFPVRDTIIKGDTVTFTDTLWGLQVDTVVTKDTVRITNIQTKTVTVRNTIHDTIIRQDRAAITALENRLSNCYDAGLEQSRKIDELQTEINEYKAKNKGKVIIRIPWWWLLVLGLAFGGWAYWRTKAGALRALLNKKAAG